MTRILTQGMLAGLLLPLAGNLLLAATGPQPDAFAERDGMTVYFDPQVQFANVAVIARDAKTATIRFDVLWEESWRNDINHDAAWVFFKVRADDTSEWQHIRLAADRVLNPSGYDQAKIAPPPPTASSSLIYYQGRTAERKIGDLESNPDLFAREQRDTSLEFIVPAGQDGFTGVFLRRAQQGGGTVTAHGVTVVCDLTGLKGVAAFGKAKIRPFGLLMVYVPEGPFYLGTGGTETSAFYAYDAGKTKTPPYRVTSAGAIPTGRKSGKLWARPGAQPEDGGEIPSAFPNGYGAFYCMKKNITPRNYAEYLEILTPAQADARFHSGNFIERSGEAPNYAYTFHPGGPRGVGSGMRCVSWEDGVSFAAWAGLRPMTELEFEKAVRGLRLPCPDEVGPSCWRIGAISCFQWDSIKGWESHCERAVTVGNARGRSFKGTHGLGTLALPADWPQADAVGSGRRYNNFTFPRGMDHAPKDFFWAHCLDLSRTRVSDRFGAAAADVARLADYKFRCVRTAPKEAGAQGAAAGSRAQTDQVKP